MQMPIPVFIAHAQLLLAHTSFLGCVHHIMVKNKLFLLIICCLAANAAWAQQMYKIVGPDGKITFSDRPQIEEKSKLSVMQSYTLRPVVPPPSRVDPGQALKASARSKAAQAGPAAVITPEVEEAMVTIMGLNEFGRRFEGFCNSTAVEARDFAGAVNGWKQRNAAPIDHQKRLLATVVSPAKRAELVDREQQLLGDEIGKAAARSPEARKEWCAGVIAELNSGRSDVDKPAMMAVPLTPYRAK
jgi:hypothetical protein